MSNNIFDDVSNEILESEDGIEADVERIIYLQNFKTVAQSDAGKVVLASLLKKFRMYKLSSGSTPELTAGREGVRQAGLVILGDIQEAAPDELNEIISKTL